MSEASEERKIHVQGDEEAADAPEARDEDEIAADDDADYVIDEADLETVDDDDTPDLEPVDVEALIAERDKLLAERDEFRDQMLRARADFDNFRKRVARESEQQRKAAAANVIRELLPILDNLELALKHVADPNDSLAQGVDMVVKQFMEALQRAGLEPIPAVGAEFDPNVHEAVMQEASDETPENCIVKEFQRGYRLGEQVLRPSKVVVSSGGGQ